jgi:hypothetical protein
MVWLWMLFPAVLLGAAALLWRASTRVDAHRRDLEDQRSALPATRREQARR